MTIKRWWGLDHGGRDFIADSLRFWNDDEPFEDATVYRSVFVQVTAEGGEGSAETFFEVYDFQGMLLNAFLIIDRDELIVAEGYVPCDASPKIVEVTR